jgi:hypothetical protein
MRKPMQPMMPMMPTAKPGAKKPVPPKVMKKVEASKQDQMRDKKMGYREGSKADLMADAAQGRRMMAQAGDGVKPGAGVKKKGK